MDKETLSNYGWIVICVLVLAVMLALATPFGTFVADAIKSTTQGLFDVNQNALNSTGLINIDGQTFGEGGNGGAGNGGSGDQGGSNTLPEAGKTAEEYTWVEIKAISEVGKGDEYFNLGDTKTFTTTNGIEVVMEIVAFNADTKADGTGTAGITWLSKGVVTTHSMNDTSTNTDGWDVSAMNAWMQSDLYGTLPTDVKTSIVKVNKTYYDYTSKSTKTCENNIWIPSYREMFGVTPLEDSGPSYTEYFTNNNSRIKYNSNGSTTYWWLRSSSGDNASVFHSVSYKGESNIGYANSAYGVVLGFCT